MIYLNDDFEGGSTDFKRTDEVPKTGMAYKEFKVWPKGGMLLLFPHKLMHQGSPVTRGAKYVLRTDVMYKRIV